MLHQLWMQWPWGPPEVHSQTRWSRWPPLCWTWRRGSWGGTWWLYICQKLLQWVWRCWHSHSSSEISVFIKLTNRALLLYLKERTEGAEQFQVPPLDQSSLKVEGDGKQPDYYVCQRQVCDEEVCELCIYIFCKLAIFLFIFILNSYRDFKCCNWCAH